MSDFLILCLTCFNHKADLDVFYYLIIYYKLLQRFKTDFIQSLIHDYHIAYVAVSPVYELKLINI